MVGRMTDPRELLLAERARAGQRVAALEREFAGIAEAASAGGTDDEHDPEGATLAFERQHTAALLDQARERLTAIDAALARLEDGRYGRCDRCGQPIGADRLAARPAALTCIRCAVLPGPLAWIRCAVYRGRWPGSAAVLPRPLARSLFGAQRGRGTGPGRPARWDQRACHGDDHSGQDQQDELPRLVRVEHRGWHVGLRGVTHDRQHVVL
jgi:DnaK suppressor protein